MSNKKPGGFTSYFRKKKEKRSLSKRELEKRVHAKEKLREVLAPVAFSVEEEERLRELKQYKKWKRMQQQQLERYQELRENAMPAIPESRPQQDGLIGRDLRLPGGAVPSEGLAKRTMAALHQHTWEQRISIVSSLMVLLFLSLHADTICKRILPEKLFWDNSLVPWYIIVLKDCGIFCHMSACSLIHFALCDISLIYAFESMELGTKMGPNVKEFYREKVHVIVAAISGGFVALSICKALLLAWFRMLRDLLETAMAMASLWKDACVSLVQGVGYVSTALVNGVINCVHTMMTTHPSEWFSSAFTGLARLITGICIWFLAMVIPFDANERPLMERVIMMASENATVHATNQAKGVSSDGKATSNQELGDAVATALNATMNETLSETGAPESVPLTWREDAFETCQWLLSHSAFFLVTLLVSMHFLTSSYRHKNGNQGGTAAAASPDDQSSIRTSPSLARDEMALLANYSTDTSMETQSTVNPHRPTSITVTICAESVTSRGNSRHG